MIRVDMSEAFHKLNTIGAIKGAMYKWRRGYLSLLVDAA